MKKLLLSLLVLSGLMISGLAQAEGGVVRAIVTTGVADREPVNDLERVLDGNDKVLFFTELRDMEGQTIKHRWSHGGEVMAEVEFNVKGPRWRIWSSKNLIPEWAGAWSVAVIDGEGNSISEKSFEFAADSLAEPQASEEAPAAEAVGDVAAPAEGGAQ